MSTARAFSFSSFLLTNLPTSGVFLLTLEKSDPYQSETTKSKIPLTSIPIYRSATTTSGRAETCKVTRRVGTETSA
jgi:hypothetical protein